MKAKDVLAKAADKVAATLEPHGFVRRGLKFVRSPKVGLVSVVEMQRSKTGNDLRLAYVINFGVIIPDLFIGDIKKPEYGGYHWGRRVSGPDGREIWHLVCSTDDPEKIASDLIVLLERQILPAIDAKQREEDLISLWMTGKGPGLVAGQRLLYLGILLHRAGRREEFEQVKAALRDIARNSFELNALGQLEQLGT